MDAQTLKITSDFFQAVYKGNTDKVELLLKDSRVDPGAVDNSSIIFASQNGHYRVVELLLKDPRVNPSARDNLPIQTASEHGHDRIVELLLKDPQVNPSARDNYAIRFASRNGHYRVVELLLNDPRVDPGAADNSSIIFASQNGHYRVVELLLKDPRVNPSVRDNLSIIFASQDGHYRLVELLLKDTRVDPSARNNLPIQTASDHGHDRIVELLLKDPRVDPSARDNYAIRFASRNGHYRVVELLLNDPRIDPGAADNLPIISATGNGHILVVKLLLKDSRLVYNKELFTQIFNKYPKLEDYYKGIVKNRMMVRVKQRKSSEFRYSKTENVTEYEEICSDISGAKVRKLRRLLNSLVDESLISKLNNREICYLSLITYDSLEPLIEEFYSKPYYNKGYSKKDFNSENCGGEEGFLTGDSFEDYEGSAMIYKDGEFNRCFSIEEVEWMLKEKRDLINTPIDTSSEFYRELLEFKKNHDDRFKIPAQIQEFIYLMRERSSLRYSNSNEEMDAKISELATKISDYVSVDKLREFLNKGARSINESLRGTILHGLISSNFRKSKIIDTLLEVLGIEDENTQTRKMSLVHGIDSNIVGDFMNE